MKYLHDRDCHSAVDCLLDLEAAGCEWRLVAASGDWQTAGQLKPSPPPTENTQWKKVKQMKPERLKDT